MKEKIAITIDSQVLSILDKLVLEGIGKNRSQVIENFLKNELIEKNNIHAFIIANDIKWDNGKYHESIPKYLLPINGKSVIFHQLKNMSQGGIKRVTIIIEEGKKELFKTNLQHSFPHIFIDYVEVKNTDKTGTSIVLATQKLSNANYILITNGDTYIPEISILDLIKYHQQNNADWTFVLKYIRTNLKKFGNVTIQGNHIYEFIEKPSSPDLFKYLTNCGWYLISRDFWDSLSYDGKHLEIDLFPFLMNKGNILAYIHSKEWFHIQSYAEYELANE